MGAHQHLDYLEPIADFLGANAKTGMSDSMSKMVKPFVRIFVKDDYQREWGGGHETKSSHVVRSFGDDQGVHGTR